MYAVTSYSSFWVNGCEAYSSQAYAASKFFAPLVSTQWSAQAVVPSLGIVSPAGNLACRSWLVMSGQPSPMTTSPLWKSWVMSPAVTQYFRTFGRSSSILALTLARSASDRLYRWLGSFGSSMPRYWATMYRVAMSSWSESLLRYFLSPSSPQLGGAVRTLL